jgi:hypothetical protein
LSGPRCQYGSLLLGFANLEHLGAAARADTLSRRSLVLHDDGLGTLHFLLGATLDTITLHGTPPI